MGSIAKTHKAFRISGFAHRAKRVALQISVSSFAVTALAGFLMASISVGAPYVDSDAPAAEINAAMPVVDQPVRDQIRMEQTVIIRIPSAAPPPKGKAKDFQEEYSEEKMGGCVVMKKIAGVRVTGKQTLELLTVDGHLVRAYLNKGCEAREFYSGFYIEKPGDGRFCKNREILHARSGAECSITKFRLLKAK